MPATKGKRLSSVGDLLCNMGELAPVFRANYNKQDIPTISYGDPSFDPYLKLEVLDKDQPSGFLYTRIR